MGNKYKLIFQNNSTNFGKACVYQTAPDVDADVMSLAWFVEPCHPTTNSTFTWGIEYDFIWDITGELVPGVVFKSSQIWTADLTRMNSVTFNYNRGAYTFTNLKNNGKPGKLEVYEDSTIPLNQASVGVAMAGAGTFVRQAQPNKHLFFAPHPEYWITFGNFEQGEVLDVTEITDSKKIVFPSGVYSMKVTLNEDNTWTVKPAL